MALPGVDYIEQDKIIRANAVAGSWGVDRIDQRDLPLNDDMTINSKLIFHSYSCSKNK